jgi:hypothetical protein
VVTENSARVCLATGFVGVVHARSQPTYSAACALNAVAVSRILTMFPPACLAASVPAAVSLSAPPPGCDAAGADVNLRNNKTETPLMLLVSRQHTHQVVLDRLLQVRTVAPPTSSRVSPRLDGGALGYVKKEADRQPRPVLS